jgi:ABC-type glycerol-3-phosphate transport system substrate-binding protein
MGTYNEYFSFYFNEGRNTIGLVSLREPMVIRHVRVHQAPEALPYAEVAAQRANLPRPSMSQVETIRIEGQNAVRKSSAMLAPAADTGGPGVYPYDAKYIRVNHIGGGSWSAPGSWIEWEFEVPQAGLYSIAMNVRQNFQRGANSFRRITINGEVPFTEMEAVAFQFESNWRVDTLGGTDDPYLFWFEEGTNIIRMETVLGDYAWYLREIQDISLTLNELYRQIVMLTSTTPDVFRDYQLGLRLPHLQGELISCRERLDSAHANLIAMAPGRGGRDAMIRSISQLLTRMYNDVENIPRRVSDFQINIGSLGTWLMMVREQSLAIDAIYIVPYDAPTPTNAHTWWRQIWHEILTLFWSFIIDFNTVPSSYEGEITRTVEVWIGTGRDQANVIKSLIDETFTRETGIGVTLMLVDPATILPATVAGQGPDVVLSMWNAAPMDYGLRGAVADISGMPGFQEVTERFHPAAMTPYRFEDRVFALPETLTFAMLFYRKDILYEIGLEPPDNWDEVRSAIAHLSKFHMEFGLPVTLPADGQIPIDIADATFTMFLYQRGGTLYNEDNTASALDSDVSLNAFRDFTRFYTDYNLEKEYNFMNRFRLGVMPLAVADYTNFNVLQIFAPEIRGLWGFRPVPGTIQADGSIDRSVPTGGMAVMMMETAKDKGASWDFMKWWTEADTQTMFGQRMEALMGAAARHPTANMESFTRMPWAVADYQQLREQMEWAQGLPQIPGAYFTPRQIRNAFFTTVELEDIGAREALTDFTRFINDEIRAKRREFGLD